MFLRKWARLLRFRRDSRGQGIVEFAIAVPVLLLILLIVIDAGRLFYGYVALQNASRIAASYAADHADAWPGLCAGAGRIRRDGAARHAKSQLRPIARP